MGYTGRAALFYMALALLFSAQLLALLSSYLGAAGGAVRGSTTPTARARAKIGQSAAQAPVPSAACP